MLDFLSVFHAESSQHHLSFTRWKEFVLSEQDVLDQASCSDLSSEFKLGISSGARSILYGVQQVMIQYEDVIKVMNDEGKGIIYNYIYSVTSIFTILPLILFKKMMTSRILKLYMSLLLKL